MIQTGEWVFCNCGDQKHLGRIKELAPLGRSVVVSWLTRNGVFHHKQPTASVTQVEEEQVVLWVLAGDFDWHEGS